MYSEVLECALYNIRIRLNVSDTGLTAVSSEDGKRRRFIFGIEIRYAIALFSICTIKNSYYRITFLHFGHVIISGFIAIISRLRYSDNIGEFVHNFFRVILARTYAFPDRRHILAQECPQHFQIAYDSDADCDNCDEQHKWGPE